MVTSILVVVLVLATWNLRRERRKFQDMIASDGVIHIYLEPEAGLSPSLDVYSEEALALKENAQWN
jgi:hypothetical protein